MTRAMTGNASDEQQVRKAARSEKWLMERNARIYYNAGIQDFGRTIIKKITAADPKAWIQMQIEAGDVNVEQDPKPTTEDEES